MKATLWPPQDQPVARADSLRRGHRFRCISGRLWTFARRDGNFSEQWGGIIWADCDDGKHDCFCGSALVVPLGTNSQVEGFSNAE